MATKIAIIGRPVPLVKHGAAAWLAIWSGSVDTSAARGHDHVVRSVLSSVLLALGVWSGASAQELPILHLKVSVLNADRGPIPVARHALLISENPATAAPRRVVTSAAGTAQIRLRPGNYTVESDGPFVLDGRAFEWVESVEVVAGRDTTLALTADAAGGAVKADVRSEAATAPNAPELSRESILGAWQASAFELWTPLVHAAGFLADERGLVATSLRAIGDATSVEVQVSQAVKVTGAVIVADRSRDVAVVRVHPSAIDGIRPVPLACDATDAAPVDPDRYVIDVPLFGPKDINSSLDVSSGAAGGPVFASDGRAVGLRVADRTRATSVSSRESASVRPSRRRGRSSRRARLQPTRDSLSNRRAGRPQSPSPLPRPVHSASRPISSRRRTSTSSSSRPRCSPPRKGGAEGPAGALMR